MDYKVEENSFLRDWNNLNTLQESTALTSNYIMTWYDQHSLIIAFLLPLYPPEEQISGSDRMDAPQKAFPILSG